VVIAAVALSGLLLQPIHQASYASALPMDNNKGPDGWPEPQHVPGTLLVKFKKGVSENEKRAVIAQNSGKVSEELNQLDVKVIQVPDSVIDILQTRLSADSRVSYVEKDYLFESQGTVIPNDPNASAAWHLDVTNAFSAYETAKGAGINIAILDTGVQPDHPDLIGKLLPGGYNFYNGNSNWSDACGHGTAVAGVAAATTNNGIGVSGAAWDSNILPLKVTDPNCYATSSALGKAILYAADNGARVANISFQIYNGQFLTDAAKYLHERGGVVVASAGNTGSLANYADNPYIISVGATNGLDNIEYYSTYGPYVDFAAPGSSIPTTYLGSKYASFGGTSAAAPVVSGIVALMLSANPSTTPAQVYDNLKMAAIDLGAEGRDYYYGWGRIDANAAVKYSKGTEGDFVPPQTHIVEARDGSGSQIPLPSGGGSATPSTSSTSITISFEGRDNTQVSGYECRLDMGAYFSCTSPATYNGLSKNYHSAYVRAIDTAGNKDKTAAFVTWQVVEAQSTPTTDSSDSEPPVVIAPADQVAEATSSLGAAVNYPDPIATDNLALSSGPACSPTSGSTFALGTTTVVCSAIDTAGNIGTASFLVIVQDTSAPIIDFPSSGISVETETSSDTTAIVSFEISANDVVDGSVSVKCDAISGSSFPVGQTTVTCSASDKSGNDAWAEFDVIVVQRQQAHDLGDQSPPVVSITSPSDGATVKGTVTISVSAYDDSGKVSKVEFYIEGVLKESSTTDPYNYSWNTKGLKAGTMHVIMVKAYDQYGNESSASITVIIGGGGSGGGNNGKR
jgi:thermitase